MNMNTALIQSSKYPKQKIITFYRMLKRDNLNNSLSGSVPKITELVPKRRSREMSRE